MYAINIYIHCGSSALHAEAIDMEIDRVGFYHHVILWPTGTDVSRYSPQTSIPQNKQESTGWTGVGWGELAITNLKRPPTPHQGKD